MERITRQHMLLRDIEKECWFWGEIEGKEWLCYRSGMMLIRFNPKNIQEIFSYWFDGYTKVLNITYTEITHINTKY